MMFHRMYTMTLLVLVTFFGTLSLGYGFFDSIESQQSLTLTIGEWEFVIVGPIDASVATQITAIIDALLDADPNDPIQNIYTQTGNMSGITIVLPNIEMFGYVWDIVGIGTQPANSTLGYINVIDRIETTLGAFVHPILPPPPPLEGDPLPYPEYNYFIANDVKNILTNNRFSLRLNYGVTMTSSLPIDNLTNISFYASRGLYDSVNDNNTLAENRQFNVSISTDGQTWIDLGNAAPPTPTSNAYAFPLYSYSIPSQYSGQSLYVRIIFDGESLGRGGNRTYSRMIIDALTLSTDDE